MFLPLIYKLWKDRLLHLIQLQFTGNHFYRMVLDTRNGKTHRLSILKLISVFFISVVLASSLWVSPCSCCCGLMGMEMSLIDCR